jgi:hypothetical protein
MFFLGRRPPERLSKQARAPLRPNAPASPEQRITILLTFSKGIFFHEDLGS